MRGQLAAGWLLELLDHLLRGSLEVEGCREGRVSVSDAVSFNVSEKRATVLLISAGKGSCAREMRYERANLD